MAFAIRIWLWLWLRRKIGILLLEHRVGRVILVLLTIVSILGCRTVLVVVLLLKGLRTACGQFSTVETLMRVWGAELLLTT